MAGAGFTATLLGVRAGLEGFSPTVTGVVLSAFYAGFLAGSLITPQTIWRVGHVRAFAGLASLASAAVLVHTVRPDPLTWFVLRGVAGLCLAGLYVATETWLNGAATNSTRGGLLAGYTIVVIAAQGIGQLLFPLADPRGYAAFVLASVLVSLAVVPVSLSTVSPPPVDNVQRMSFGELFATAPLSVVAVVAAGFSSAAFIGGGGAVYAAEVDLTRWQTSALLFGGLLGALILQVPFGRWSDGTDRRRVLIAAAVMGVTGAILAALATGVSIPAVVLLGALVGATSFLLYTLGSAHLNDHIGEHQIVAGGAGMVLLFGAGAVAGPVGVSVGIGLGGPRVMFVLIAVSYGVVAVFAAYRLTVRPPVPEEARATYAAAPMGTSPTVATLGDVNPEALHPEPIEETTVETDTGDVTYLAHGQGAPVVLLGTAPYDGAWARLLFALSANGLQAVEVELHSMAPDAEGEHALLAVLRDRALASATFVGLNGGSVQVAEFVAEHPERVEAVVLAGPALPMAAHQTGLDDRALLLLTEDDAVPYWDEPELFADTVADFVRRTVRG